MSETRNAVPVGSTDWYRTMVSTLGNIALDTRALKENGVVYSRSVQGPLPRKKEEGEDDGADSPVFRLTLEVEGLSPGAAKAVEKAQSLQDIIRILGQHGYAV